MRTKLTLYALLLTATLTQAFPQPPGPAQQLLDRWAQALGGKERLTAVRGLHTRMQIETGGLQGTVETWSDAQGRGRQLTELGGTKELNVFDGTQGWKRDTVGKVRALEGKELENTVTDAYLASYSQFFDGRMKGRVEYAGDEGKTSKLRIVPEHGEATTVFLDKSTGLPLREVRPSQERTLTLYYEEWKDFGGIKLPVRIRQGTGDPTYDVRATIAEADFQPIDAALFRKPESTGKDFQFANDAASITLPFQLNSNHIYVQARVNGSRPLWCIFDSGAETTVVNSERMSDLGLKAQGKLEGRGAGGKSVNVGIIENADVEFERARMNPRPVAAIPLTPVEAREGREIDGIIGYDIISSFVVEIDYAARKLTLHDPARFAGTNLGEAVPFTFEGNLPIIRAQVGLPGREPIEGRFLVDTGARMSIELNAPFVRTHNARQAFPKAFPAPGGFGVGGATSNLVARLESFQLGKIKLTQPITYLSQDEKGSGADPTQAGLIGGDLLRRFKVTFDYARQFMYLAPNQQFSEPFEYDMSGMALSAGGPDFRRFSVERLVENSPAAEAGIRVGDKLVRFQEKPASSFTLEEIRQELRREPGRELRMEVERDGRTIPVVLKTRRLI